MVYRFYTKGNNNLHMMERHSNSKIEYCSKKKMKELYLDGSWDVIGEINNLTKVYPGQDNIMTDTGKYIPIFPRGSLKRPLEWVAGYAEVEENVYVAVIGSIVPHWI